MTDGSGRIPYAVIIILKLNLTSYLVKQIFFFTFLVVPALR